MNENKLKREFSNVSENIIDKLQRVIKDGDITDPKHKSLINEFLNGADYTYCNCLGEYISSLFGIDRADLLAKDKTVNVTYARAMWWLAMRQMLNKQYSQIALMSSFENVEWDTNTVIQVVNRLYKEIGNKNGSYELKYKWDLVKKLIIIGRKPNEYDAPFSSTYGYKIRVMKPRDINVEVVDLL